MTLKWFIAVTFLVIDSTLVRCQYFGENEGDACGLEEAEGAFGTCTLDYQCLYADRLVNEEFRKPTICSANVTHTVVCCPNDAYQTGILGRTFMDSQNGRLFSGDFDCRYTGEFPLTCCNRKKNDDAAQLETRFSANCDRSGNMNTVAACKACYRYQPKREKTSSICPEETSSKISNGEPAEIAEFPHMVVLGCRHEKKATPDEPDIKWIGAGTLISETFVLTAAHVLFSPADGQIKYALSGSSNKTDIKSGIFSNIVQVKQFKKYSISSHAHDIGLVELDYPIPITEFTRPACLPVTGITPDDLPRRVRIAGWGQTRQHSETSEILMKGDMILQNAAECRKSLQTSKQMWDHRIMLCAKADVADTCYGDSGGPLMAPLDSNSRLCGYYILGIVSFSTVCAQNQNSGYTNVPNGEYLEWITNTVWPNANKLT